MGALVVPELEGRACHARKAGWIVQRCVPHLPSGFLRCDSCPGESRCASTSSRQGLKIHQQTRCKRTGMCAGSR